MRLPLAAETGGDRKPRDKKAPGDYRALFIHILEVNLTAGGKLALHLRM
ncbi:MULTISPECIES: hypothetical protein [Rhizobium]|nr:MULTISPECIES: hypothetical protein [Rhizobium]KAF5887035.1 hypothetical protein FY112_04700 [Rhizobium sp. PEPV16]MBY5770939.1 hypothetical protein [Rhizobium leguminosarum]